MNEKQINYTPEALYRLSLEEMEKRQERMTALQEELEALAREHDTYAAMAKAYQDGQQPEQTGLTYTPRRGDF